MTTFDDFMKISIRVGKIIEVENFPEAKKSAYGLKIDFGIGIKRSSVRVVSFYSKEQLNGGLVLCVVNIPPRQVGVLFLEVLTLGVPAKKRRVELVEPREGAIVGGRMY